MREKRMKRKGVEREKQEKRHGVKEEVKKYSEMRSMFRNDIYLC